MPSFRRTKIVVTLGPATDDESVLRQLIASGVDVVRLNFSHEQRPSHQRRMEAVRRVASEMGRVVAVMQDLQGPRIRVGELAGGGVELEAGASFTITTRQVPGDSQAVSTTYAQLPQQVRPGDPILLNDGLIELRVTSVTADSVECVVVHGGALTAHKGMNLPRSRTSGPAMTAKDREDLRFGLAHGVDMVALSFVRRAEDARGPRRIMREASKRVPLLAKIERPEALENLDGILRAFDGVMVARGDLAIELSAEKVPVAQKRIIERANAFGKPVITATQMLESMTRNPSPTRAEASDVANAVIDGTDAVMLSAETAIGEYPIAAVQSMDLIAREAETIPVAPVPFMGRRRSTPQAVCHAAVALATEAGARALAAYTRSGRTAMTLSKLHPAQPVFALTDKEQVARQLALWRGVIPLVVESISQTDGVDIAIGRELQARGLVPEDESIIVVGAAPQGPPGETNFIRLLTIG